MTPEQESYLVLHKASGIEVGDKVKVLRMPNDNELGWHFGGQDLDKKQLVGKVVEVAYDNKSLGFILTNERAKRAWNFPFFVLELVEKGESPIWVDGYKVQFFPGNIAINCTEIPNATCRQIVERLVDARGMTYHYCDDNGHLYQTDGIDDWYFDSKGKWVKQACKGLVKKWPEITHAEAMKITGGVE